MRSSVRGSQKHDSRGRKEYHSVSRLIFGSLFCQLKSLCERVSQDLKAPQTNTHIFYDESPKTMSDKYNGACVLVKRSIIGDLIVPSFRHQTSPPFFLHLRRSATRVRAWS